MNSDQLMSLLRTVLQIAGTALVAHGTLGITGAMWEQISGAVVMIAPVIWGIYAHTDAAKIASVASMPDVAQITVKSTAIDGAAQAAAITSLSAITPLLSGGVGWSTTAQFSAMVASVNAIIAALKAIGITA